jgi:hypothetical protein
MFSINEKTTKATTTNNAQLYPSLRLSAVFEHNSANANKPKLMAVISIKISIFGFIVSFLSSAGRFATALALVLRQGVRVASGL